MNLAVEQLERQRVLDEALEGALERAGSVVRIVSLVEENLPGLPGKLQVDLALRQPRRSRSS